MATLITNRRVLLTPARGDGLPLLDNFGGYADASVMNGQVPLLGPAWKTTGTGVPTTSNGRLVQGAATGYLYANLPAAPKIIGASVAWESGIDLTPLGFAMAMSSQPPPNLFIKNLLHHNFGMAGFNFGTFDGASVLTSLMTNNWLVPWTNNGVPRNSYFGVGGANNSTAFVIGPSNEMFAVSDPTIALNYGPMVFFEPLTQGDGFKSEVVTVYADNRFIVALNPTIFNVNDKTATMTVSADGTTATTNTTSGEPQVRSVAGRTNGNVCFGFKVISGAATGLYTAGIGMSSFGQHALTTFLGGDLKSVGLFTDDTVARFYTGAVGTNITNLKFVNGDNGRFAINLATGKCWAINDTTPTGWNGDVLANQDPSAGVGGFLFPISGAPFAITANMETAGQSFSINTNLSLAQLPAGFENMLVI